MTKTIYRRVPILKDLTDGNQTEGWHIKIRRVFNMGTAAVFDQCRPWAGVTPAGIAGWSPMFESKLMHQFNHRFGSYVGAMVVSSRSASLNDPHFTVQPRFGIPVAVSDSALASLTPNSWLLAWRDIAAPTNERTLIAAIIPRSATDFTLRLGFSPFAASKQAALLANLNSFVLDFILRQMLGGNHVSDYILHQLPVIGPEQYDESRPWCASLALETWIADRALELSFTSWALRGFASDLGYSGPPFRYDEERRALVRAELDACFFHLYGLDTEDVAYVMDTFPIVRRKDEERFGEYRTKRLILEAYEAMAKASATGDPFQTRLDPPPADPRVAHRAP
jgi:hypothetical protein